jgi:hypothetical protein
MKTNALALALAMAILLPSILFHSTVLAAEQKSPQEPQSNFAALPHYDINIVDGILILDPQKEFPTLYSRFGTKVKKVNATLDNIVDSLRDLHTNANIAMAPGLSRITIGDLKIRTGNEISGDPLMATFVALSVASGDKFITTKVGDAFTILSAKESPHMAAEVFNIGGYLNHLKSLNPGTNEVKESLEKIGALINDTVRRVKADDYTGEEGATFEFHPGSNLLIIVGDPVSLDVARKVVRALLGQDWTEPEYQKVLVIGAVARPGSLEMPLHGNLTIIDAIGLAGGTTKIANEKKIELTRNGKSEFYSFDTLKKANDPKQIIYLRPGDIIKVHESFL